MTNVPDPSITQKDLSDYGYNSYPEMLPMRRRQAETLYLENKCVYLLYPDDTEAAAESLSEIKYHDGLFGIERRDWEKYSGKAIEADNIAEHPVQPYTFKAYIENPHRPYNGGFTVPLPAEKEVLKYFLDGVEIKNVHDVKVGSVYSAHDSDDNLSYWLNEALHDMEGAKSIEELNYLGAKIQGMDDESREIFAANLHAKQYIGSIAEMINMSENLDKFDLAPFCDAESYGEYLVDMDGGDLADPIGKLEQSENEEDRELAKYIARLERNVDHAKYAEEAAKADKGKFTDYGFLRQHEDLQPIYRGVSDMTFKHRLTKPTLDETLRLGAQKSREQFGEPTKPQDKGEIDR